MELFNHELAFDLDNLKELRDGTTTVCSNLRVQRDNLTKGLQQLRKEWNTEAGRFFFDQVDTNWESDIKKYENTLNVFENVLSDAIDQFEKVVEEADKIQIDLP